MRDAGGVPALAPGGALGNKLDHDFLYRVHQHYQRVDIAGHDTLAGFSTQDGAHRQVGKGGQGTLVDPEHCPSGAHLGRGDHTLSVNHAPLSHKAGHPSLRKHEEIGRRQSLARDSLPTIAEPKRRMT
jgi:hypothetical protein